MTTAKSKNETLASVNVTLDMMRGVMIILAIIGIFVAGYMSWAELTNNETMCADVGNIDCTAVQQSAYAKTFGVPVAVLGTLGYLAILGVLILEDQIGLVAAYGRTAVVGMALFGVIFQLYLTYVEAAVLDKWCQWCVASFVTITLLLIFGGIRLKNFLEPLQK
ncbi:MAG: vitamin K epoxide reductase family protein [Anaerolineae bacterium]|nr:vitamin K epoxide reductase family protein [Anaerolineae bacterium]